MGTIIEAGLGEPSTNDSRCRVVLHSLAEYDSGVPGPRDEDHDRRLFYRRKVVREGAAGRKEAVTT